MAYLLEESLRPWSKALTLSDALGFVSPAWGFVKTWWRAGVGIFIGAVLVFPVAQCAGVHKEKDRAEAEAVKQQNKQLQKTLENHEVASGERANDTATITAKKEDLEHAVQGLPDNVPSARRVALACARLRNQGADVSKLPACNGSANRGQAPAGPGGTR
jgi:hypothetical protein